MLPPDIEALREGVALVEQAHVARVRLAGPGVFAVLDAALARAMPLQVGRAAPGLVLHADGRVLADVLVVGEADGALVLAEGVTGAALGDLLRSVAPRRDVDIEDLSLTHALVSVQGPYAWEVVGALAGPDVFAAPFHTSFLLEEIAGLGVRAGKVGEYGYDLLVPRADEPALRQIFAHLAVSHGLPTIDRRTLARCALEHGSFSVDLPGAAALTPLQLQLQWRIDYDRDVPGMAALRAQRASGSAGRLTWFFAPGDAPVPDTGQPFAVGGQLAGTVVDAFRSHALGGVVGTALLARAVAHVGLPASWTPPDAAPVPARTVGPPLLNNRSGTIHPLQHTHAERARVEHPPLSRLA